MIYELILFGGTIFWILAALATIIIFSFTESDGDWVATSAFLASVAIFWGLSQPPHIGLGWISAYFVVGILWWFCVFNLRLITLKRFLKENPVFIKNDKIDFNLYRSELNGLDLNRLSVEKMSKINDNEPSFNKFFSRTFCWPISMIKFTCDDIVRYIWSRIKQLAIAYKKNLLGVK